jgi:ribosomal protein S18 acetylase RimI-like enzyme
MMGGFVAAVIRPARRDELPVLYDVVLKTADNGGDATALHRLPDVQGDVYIGPYVTLEPDLAFVLEDDQGPAGFVLGALDSRRFEARLEQEWWPPLRLRSRDAGGRDLLPDDERLLGLIYNPQTAPETVLQDYPSHLHIDILPRQQGKGNGRKLIETLFEALAAKGSLGVHLFVGARNERAIAFYRRIGMTEFSSDARAIGMCLRLPGR